MKPWWAAGSLNGVDFLRSQRWNTAFMEEGAVVRIAPGTVVESPSAAILSRAGTPVMSHPRILAEAAGRSEATLIEHYIGEADAANFTNVVAELMLDRGAILNHYKLQERPWVICMLPVFMLNRVEIAATAPTI